MFGSRGIVLKKIPGWIPLGFAGVSRAATDIYLEVTAGPNIKVYMYRISILFLSCLLICCSASMVLVPVAPLPTADRADYRSFDLYVTSFDLKYLEESEDLNRVGRLKLRFIEYIEAKNRFHKLHDGPRMIGQSRPSLSIAVEITPEYTSHRTWILEIITFYPFLGLWPITPHWGEVTVRLKAQLYDMYGTLLKNITTTQKKDYSSFFYAVYRTGHVEDALRECYHQAFQEVSSTLSNYELQVTTYIDSILAYRMPADKQKTGLPPSATTGSSLAVVDLNAYGVSDSDARALSSRLTSELFNSGKYIILEREKINEILTEQGFQQTGCTTSECLIEAGKLLNVHMIVGGSISKIGVFHTLELRLIDVETGKIISVANEDIEGDIGLVLTRGIRRAVNQLTR
jgi:hypothetical protein